MLRNYSLFSKFTFRDTDEEEDDEEDFNNYLDAAQRDQLKKEIQNLFDGSTQQKDASSSTITNSKRSSSRLKKNAAP